MKKLLAGLLAACMAVSLTACSSGGGTDASANADSGEPTELTVFAAASLTETLRTDCGGLQSRRARRDADLQL